MTESSGQKHNKDSLRTAFAEAIAVNNAARVRALLEQGMDPNITDSLNRTIEKTDRTEIAALLLEAGADVHATDAEGYTPLHNAARYRKMDHAKLLLQWGADVNYVTSIGKYGGFEETTPLTLARKNPNFDRDGIFMPAALLRLLEDAALKAAAGEKTVPPAKKSPPLDRHKENIQKLDKILGSKKAAEETVTAGDEITLRRPLGNTGRELVEVYNFKKREKVTAIYNPKTDAFEAVTQKSFDEIRDRAALQAAFGKYKEQGGTLERDALDNPIEERLKKKLPGTGI